MSVLTVFKNAKLTPDKNFIIEDIGGFISTYYAFDITAFRSTKHDLEVTINLDLEAATNLNYFKADTSNYLCIKNKFYLIITVPSLISGISDSNNLLTNPQCVLESKTNKFFPVSFIFCFIELFS